MSSSEIVKFENLSKFYGSHVGIEDLSFSIDKGEIFGFLGPNGAGKTTTIRLMLDLIKPSSGNVKIFGLDVTKSSFDIRKRLGYLPGNFMPYDKMTGYEFLKFSLKIRRINSQVHPSYFERLELGKRDLSKKIREYSQGMKQKLGIIHAVAHQPELIILDEPSTGLDPLMQDALYELLIELNKGGSTIFFSSHNLPEVEKICEKVAIVKQGKLVGSESLSSLRKMKKKKMKITFSETPSSVPELKNAELLQKKNEAIEYLVTGDINALISELSVLEFEDILFPEPTLEDIFLGFYEKNKSHKND